MIARIPFMNNISTIQEVGNNFISGNSLDFPRDLLQRRAPSDYKDKAADSVTMLKASREYGTEGTNKSVRVLNDANPTSTFEENYGSSKSVIVQNLSSKALFLQTMFRSVDLINYHLNLQNRFENGF